MDTQQKFPEPKTIGHWKVGRIISQGSSGRVRIARHAKTGQLAAIKIVSKSSLTASHPSLSDLADQTEQETLSIEREIVIMKLLNHPNILHLYDVWETTTHLYLILEYVQGGELLDYLCKHGPLSGREALKYFRQIIEAVDYLHRFNIAHRDLKLENILLDQNHSIRVADFGVAAWQINISGAKDYMKTSCGSPHYAAPEVVRGERYNASAADIWSCGIILYAMLTARLPFDLPELLNKVVTGKFTIPSLVDPFAQNLIRRMLTVDPEARIAMSEIFEHPFFKLHSAKAPMPTLSGLSQAALPLKSKSCIDPDIFANLRILWRGASDVDLIRSLLNDDKNWQKGVYHLLVNYRANINTGDGTTEGDTAKQTARDSNGPSEGKVKGTISGLAGQRSRHIVTPACSSDLRPDETEPPTRWRTQGRDQYTVSTPAAHFGVGSFAPQDATHLAPHPTALHRVPAEKWNRTPRWSRNRPLPPLPDIEVEPTGLVNDLTRPGPAGAKQDSPFKLRTQAHPHEDTRRDVGSKVVWPNVESRPLMFSLGHNTLAAANSDSLPPGADHPQIMKLRSSETRAYRPAIDIVHEENEAVSDDGGSFIHIPITPSLRKLGMNGTSSVGRKFAKLEDRLHGQHMFGTLRNKRSLQLQQTRTQSDANSTPENGEVPKHIWLNTIFRVKSSYLTRHILYSVWDIITTRNECRRLLGNLNAQVQVFYQPREYVMKYGEHSPAVVMKCKAGEMEDPTGILGIMKPTKFRAEITNVGKKAPCVRLVERDEDAEDANGETPKITVTFIHEKGSGESFREIIRRLKAEWTLEDGDTVGLL